MPKKGKNSNTFLLNSAYEKQLRSLTFFSILSDEEYLELSALMEKKYFEPNEVLVTQDELVNSVLIIMKGRAEVTQRVEKKKRLSRKKIHLQIPVAILNAGEAIGLSETGFFSKTGKRTATVTALTAVEALVLELKKFHQFLKKHPHLEPAMQTAAFDILKMTLIKKALPFNRLSHERLEWLAKKVEEVTVPADTILFQEGEEGDCCYLIKSGVVEIISNFHEGSSKILAVLKTPTLFGETTLVTRTRRNATARAKENCELLMLRYEFLSELLETEENVAEMVMTLMVDRSRPLKKSNITEHQQVSSEGKNAIILKDPETGSYFKLSNEGQFIWQQLDGKHTLQEITLALSEEFGLFSPDMVTGLISKLAHAGFISHVNNIKTKMKNKKQALWVRGIMKMRRCLEARVAIGDTDYFLTKSYKKWVHYLFTKPGQFILASIALLGIVSFAFSTSDIILLFKNLHHSWLLFFILIPFTLLTIALHELGHAFTTKAFGHEVHYMGIGWYWLGPVAFTDTSDMWLSSRWPRIAVNLSGIYTDVIIAGCAAILIFVLINPYVQAFLWVFSLFTYINAFRMLSPLQEWDGYYVLIDLLERPRLRESSVVWLIRSFSKGFRKGAMSKKYKAEMIYWLACMVFLVMVSLLTILLQGFVFDILNFHTNNLMISLALPFCIVLISCLGIVADIRSKK